MKLPHRRTGLSGVALLVGLLFVPARASAEWQIKPFLGVTFDAATTFTLGNDVGHARKAVGVSGTLIGEIFGVEADIGHSPGFFGTYGGLVLSSGVTTITGNVVVAVPRHLMRYTLRPYVVGGAGMMRVKIEDYAAVLGGDNLPAVDFGGGVTGFLTNHVGVSWDVRYFRSLGGQPVAGVSIAPEQLSFWRANMALAIRF
jgi:hypothetical protein